MQMFKVVVREGISGKVIQIHELYASSVGAKVDEEIDYMRQYNVKWTLTITPLN